MMSWLHRLRLWQKFLLIGALALVTTAIPVTLLLSRMIDDAGAARQRTDGAVSIVALQKVIRNAQFHRGVVSASLSMEDSLASLWRDDNDEVASKRPAARDQLVQALGQFDERLRAAAPPAALTDAWQNATRQWEALDQGLGGDGIDTAQRSNELHTEWIAAMLDLSDRLVEEYGLTRAPERASNALADTAFLWMPRTAEVLGQLRAMGAIALARREVPDALRAALRYREQLAGSGLADLDRSLSFVAAADPLLGAHLGASLAEMEKDIAGALATIRREILEPDSIFLASDEYVQMMTATIDRMYAFDEEVADTLSGLFAARTAALERTALIVGVVLISVAVLALLLMVVFVRSVTVPLREAVTFAGRIADGDLGVALQARGSNEIGELVTVLGRMRARIAEVVGTVRRQADSVAVASSQIAQGNADLSARTEQQASALEQTAAAMEELSTTVQQNADHARQADQHAREASEVAVSGGRVVGDVVDTMKEINESSHRIAAIVDVIDGIAFQTNILALNAAVEAARAGEQGRGFAVVAGEVRSLAQRSADAAREIKQLIDTSVERVDRGTGLVSRAGATMQEIVSSIRRVNDIVGEISNASAEQSTGVAQVRDAVTELDQNTQHNAALVEQSAAAAAALRAQSHDLVRVVAVFRLGAGPGTGTRRAGEAASVDGSLANDDPAAITVDRRGPDRATNVTRLPRPQAGVPGVGGGPDANEDEARDALRA